ncbi:MAG: hypothetical protein MUF51_01265 [Vicinamibacteria bacterium]|nr:hypothetical protein [Vicinamibacteria bacterium]
MIIEFLFGCVYVVSAAISVGSLVQLNRFLAGTRSITDEACLDRFKSLARIQMYLALAITVLLGSGMLLGMALIMKYGLFGLACVLVVNMLLFGIAMYHKSVEGQARSLPTGSEDLAKEYRRVSESWVKKPLPDF